MVDYGPDGIELRPGATIARRVDNPHGLTPPDSSLGLVVEFEGETIWLSVTSTRSGGSGTSETAEESGWPTFDEWLAAEVALQAGSSGLELVSMDDNGDLTPEQGVEILEQQADPDLTSYIGDSVTASAVAMVRRGDATWFVLVIREPGTKDSVTNFAAAKTDGATNVDEFIAFARTRGDEGGGLR